MAGIIETIFSLISEKQMTREEILESLMTEFPDRDPAKMMKTIYAQVPNRLSQSKKVHIVGDSVFGFRVYNHDKELYAEDPNKQYYICDHYEICTREDKEEYFCTQAFDKDQKRNFTSDTYEIHPIWNNPCLYAGNQIVNIKPYALQI